MRISLKKESLFKNQGKNELLKDILSWCQDLISNIRLNCFDQITNNNENTIIEINQNISEINQQLFLSQCNSK